jgi:hypothetical protein
MKTSEITQNLENDATPALNTDLSQLTQSNSCYSHNYPYFNEPVHAYDYSEDWNLEEEWNARKFGICPILLP